ncbi:MAG: LptF/LptG family permease [Phocaeicola sp.]|nr:LptF/LptG family permease [Phocaeicola sp.]MDD7448880.1 LptF/LptG family permease [Prevotellaceae bacterium]MDY3913518.1 LptF/LptG family permease [Phocaeicola sp.]MDY5938275.1 LptF/LptG family permease [Phocaeicola sp.]
MLRIKKLDIFLLKSYLLVFAGTFFICLFIFMMQFLWKYVDELVGKGLSFDVFAQFFVLAGITLIPMSLPLAILLASLITFGNFGERYELLSMKAAGISLLRILRPIALLCTFLGFTSFYFQDVIGPSAQKELWTLLISMKMKTPEVEIPEEVFYNDMDGINIYVKKKDPQTGELKDVLVYDFREGFENARIVWAERGKLEMSADNQFIVLHFYNGEQFENLREQAGLSNNVPYRRETFKEKHAIIPFDTNFNKVDGNFLDERADTKGMERINLAIDSLTHYADSVGRLYYDRTMQQNVFRDRVPTTEVAEVSTAPLRLDSIFRSLNREKKLNVLQQASMEAQNMMNMGEVEGYTLVETEKNIRSHISAWHRKFTLSLACLLFFFIGAPLGSIIRKGGLGTPVVISVLFFVLYYIIDTGAMRIAKTGGMSPILGTWISSLVLAPIGFFLTYKSNRDSVVFNIDTYTYMIRRFFGIRGKRHIARKEVIIYEPGPTCATKLSELSTACNQYLALHLQKITPNYIKLFWYNDQEAEVRHIVEDMDKLIEELSNTKNAHIINALNKFPYLASNAHLLPIRQRWQSVLCGVFFPIGICLWVRIWKYRKRLKKDLQTIISTNQTIIELLQTPI